VLRLSSSPASFALAYRTWFDIDVRHILGSIQAPTLVIHDAVGDIDEARYVVERIPFATLAALPRNEGQGECDLIDGKLSGIAVAVGARVAAQAAEGEVLVSGTVRDLVAGSEIEFDSRGMRELKGLGEWPLYAVSGI
jgi:class 3 adenylate cyclase